MHALFARSFVAFFAVSLTLFLIVRHVPTKTTSYSPTTFLERLLLSFFAFLGAGAVSSSRVYLNYHTPRQVWVGVVAGAMFSVIWFLFTASCGILDGLRGLSILGYAGASGSGI